MFKTDETNQKQLFAFSVRELVADDSDVWLYIDFFDHLCLEAFDWDYSSQGQASVEPKLMLRSLFYGLTHGIVSGRRLEDACRNDNRYVVLSGGHRPDRRTFDRFLIRHAHHLDELFSTIVRLAQKMGLARLGRIAIDGSRFKGKASVGKSMPYKSMEAAICRIQENLSELRASLAKENNARASEQENKLAKNITDQSRRLEKIKKAKLEIEKEYAKTINTHQKTIDSRSKSLGDPEAQALGSLNKTFMYGYNMQLAVDDESQIIVAAHVNDRAVDSTALPELVREVEENCGLNAEEILADQGYQSLANLKAIQMSGAEAFIPWKPKSPTGIDFIEQITYNEDTDTYSCPRGHNLKVYSRGADGYLGTIVPRNHCTSCEFKDRCTAYGKKYAQIMPEQDRLLVLEHLKKSRTEEFKTIVRRRKAIVEGVFGNIKNKGLRIMVTGRSKVTIWWRMACMAHNIEKIIKNGLPSLPAAQN